MKNCEKCCHSFHVIVESLTGLPLNIIPVCIDPKVKHVYVRPLKICDRYDEITQRIFRKDIANHPVVAKVVEADNMIGKYMITLNKGERGSDMEIVRSTLGR